MLISILTFGQGDTQVRAKADGFFLTGNYIDALPLYSQLVSNNPSDRVLNYRFGTCLLFGGDDKDKAIGHLKYAVEDPAIPADAWYWLGRAYHLNYLFKEARTAYQRYQGTATKKELAGVSVSALDNQCRNGQQLLNNLKEITVRNKVEVDEDEFFRFYDLSDIGGKIVVLPEELKTSYDKKSKERFLVYLPDKGGAIYFSSYGKDGRTGRDIYRTELLNGGAFATPMKLAGYVNTDEDENFPVLHPDGRSFYFSSKGHNSMGGYDVFRSAYDKGLDVFGPPENMDFAVNTPDDDLFYMVDPENKEACFASGRHSEQGKLHVYRVGTAQVPLVVTALKGTFSNSFDPTDRKAHIMVEDAVTRERVADVRTDINGSYVLALPRSGSFKFLVECGPAGRTHQGQVEIPRSAAARAYRQELELNKTGGIEKLLIRNYFDTPLDEDMIALMMEEIKRRARLDITKVERVAPAAPEPVVQNVDPLSKAGFAGDMTEAKAVELAREDANELEKLSRDLNSQGTEAFGLALQAVSDAERTGKEAEALVNTAELETDEEARKAIMLQAAEQRQLSREATQRARAALRTGQDLQVEALSTEMKAAAADKLATDLQSAVASKLQQESVKYMTALKTRLDAKSGPQSEVAPAERARLAAVEQDAAAAKLLRAANTKRAEENDFIDRITRDERELAETKNKGRKEELAQEVTQSKQQLAYLHDEVDGAFTKARDAERQAALLRGQASLTAHLSKAPSGIGGTELNKEQILGLGQRIAGNEGRIAALPIDERYDAAVVAERSKVEARTFDWNGTASASKSTEEHQATLAMKRDVQSDAQNIGGRGVSPPQGELSGGKVRDVAIPHIDPTLEQETASASGQVAVADPDVAKNGNAGAGSGVTAAGTQQGVSSDPEGVHATTGDPMARRDPKIDTGRENDRMVATNAGKQGTEETVGTGVMDTDRRATSSATSAQEAGPGGSTSTRRDAIEGEEHSRTVSRTAADPIDPELNTFLLENQLAELQQAFNAERNKSAKDSLQKRMNDVKVRLTAAQAPVEPPAIQQTLTEEEDSHYGVDMRRVPLVFHETTKDDTLVAKLYKNYALDKQRMSTTLDPTERAEGLSGLELMLADSLRSEMVRQAAVLELAPEQGARVLPKVERLRQLRQEHLQESERILAGQESIAAETTRVVPTDKEVRVERTRVETPLGEDPVADRFIAIQPDRELIYRSKIEHRAEKVNDAVAFKEADIARIDILTMQIDSIEEEIAFLPKKEYEKQRKSADKLIDERMIIRTDLGQRSAYLMKEEWSTANDSVKLLDKKLASLGLAPDENLVMMANAMKGNAKIRFAEAEKLRKQADRGDDLLMRDSLYRAAYASELEALHEMDKAITVKNYLVGGEFTRGESLAYETIARRVLGISDPVLAQAVQTERKSVANDPAKVVSNKTAGITPDITKGVEPVATNTSGQEETTNTVRSTVSSGSETEQATERLSAPDRSAATTVEGSASVIIPQAPGSAVNVERAKEKALQDALRSEAAVPASALVPVKRYEVMLGAENVTMQREEDPEKDGDLLTIKSNSAARRSAELEQRSLELSDRATALEDSAGKARKRDQDRLMAMAVRTHTTSDSLHAASLAMAEEARDLELQRRDAEQAKGLRQRLVKYYYLTPEEQSMVEQDAGQSRYFQMKARALEQYDAATEAENAARINSQLGRTLQQQVATTNADVKTGRLTPVEGGARNEVLMSRSNLFQARADSLNNVAARLRGAAGINEGQASVLMQALPAERSNEWMALEMRTRRTETLLAEARDQAGRGAAVPKSAPVSTNASETIVQYPATGAQVVDNTSLPERTRVTPPASSATGPESRPIDPEGNTSGTEPRTTRTINAPFGTDSGDPKADNRRSGTVGTSGAILAVGFPTELVTDIFELRPAGDRDPVAIPMDVKLPNGVVFKVQIGAFRKPIPEEAFSDMTPVSGERVDGGLVRYTAGLFMAFEQASRAKDLVRDRGYRDAFVVAYRDGERITLREGMAAVNAEALASAPTNVDPGNSDPRTRTSVPNATTRTNEGVTPVGTRSSEVPVVATEPAIIQRPVVIGTPTAAPPEEDPLTNYPTTAEEIVGRFQPVNGAADYYNDPSAAPARQVETIRGLFYTVQVGVYSKPVALGKIFNISPLNTERTANNMVRYTTGIYTDTGLARVRKDETVVLGVKDAFVTAYLNGKRIPMREAAALITKFGPSILATP